MADVRSVTYRLDPETLSLIDQVAQRYNFSHASALKYLVRRGAQTEGLIQRTRAPHTYATRRGRPHKETP